MADFIIKRNDRRRPLQLTLTDALGAAVDLTGATVVFHMRLVGATAMKITGGAVTVDSPATAGNITYAWGANDLNALGEYRGECAVTFPDGKVETFPSNGYITISVVADLA